MGLTTEHGGRGPKVCVPGVQDNFLTQHVLEPTRAARVGETGASCYNFHSNSIFHKNMQAQDFFWT